MKFIKKNYKYLILFLYFFICLEFIYTAFSMDTYVNYAFSYGMSYGIPYKDYNLIVPIFSPIVYYISLIISKNIIFLFLEQAFLLTIMVYFINKLLGSKSYLFLFIMLLPFPIPFVYSIFPGYNFIFLLLLILLIYFEEKDNDLVVGIILGLLIITKHTLGIVFLIPSLIYYRKNIKTIIKRYLYALIPIGVFLIYLIIMGSLNDFYNLCILGLFDFSLNKVFNFFYILLVLITLIINIIVCIKKKSLKTLLYLISYLLIIYPIMDIYHVSLYLLFSIFIFLYNIDKLVIRKSYLFLVGSILLSCSYFYISYKSIGFSIKNMHNFTYKIITKYDYDNFKLLNKYTKNKNNVITLFPVSKNVFYYVYNNKKLDYYYILNKGNYGYNGNRKVLNKIKSESNKLFVLDDSEDFNSKYCQYMVDVYKYVKSYYKLVKIIGNYSIYYKE